MSTVSTRLLKIASMVLDRGQPSLFKRLSTVGAHIARADRTNTDVPLADAIEDERSNEPPIEVVDSDDDGEKVPPEESRDKEEDEDVEGFVGFPMGALGQKERRKGPHPKDVKPGRPDWWNPR